MITMTINLNHISTATGSSAEVSKFYLFGPGSGFTLDGTGISTAVILRC